MTDIDDVEGWFGLFPDGSSNLTFSLNEDHVDYFDQSGDCLLHPSWDSPAAIKRKKSLKFLNIMFKPQGLYLVSGIPSSEYAGKTLAVECLFSAQELSVMKDKLLNCSNRENRFGIIEQYLLQKFRHDLVDSRVDFGVEAIYSGTGDINALSDKVCLSQRRFRELFSHQTGFSPAYFKKLARFLNSSKQMKGNSLTEVAFSNGYYDQSHFIKDFKQFSGITPSTYLRFQRNSADFYNYDLQDLNTFVGK